MANRQNTFLLKRSSVPGKVPSPGDIKLGEIAINTADVILYASGTTQNQILPIGWDRIHRTGDTMTGTLYTPSLSATSISATTYYGLPVSKPYVNNKSQVVTGTTIGDNFNTGIIISGTPISNSYVGVTINGVNAEVGNGVTTKDCYFSSNGTSGGVRNFSGITTGDYFMWNTTISGYDLDSEDIVSFYFNILT
jgi:hypothetical protein